MPEPDRRPAFYAASTGGWRDWQTLLHPPYTAWHLSYVVIGASLAPRVDGGRLLATMLAFFLAVGVAAHALDELQGRPLRTQIADETLIAATVVGLVSACAIGAVGVARVGLVLLPFIVAGALLVVAYNLEWFGGVVHTDAGFALAWGAFPVVTAYVAQSSTLRWPPLLAAAGAFALAYAQRTLSTPARRLRRQVDHVEGAMLLTDGATEPIDATTLRAPLERALKCMSWGVIALAAALALARL